LRREKTSLQHFGGSRPPKGGKWFGGGGFGRMMGSYATGRRGEKMERKGCTAKKKCIGKRGDVS